MDMLISWWDGHGTKILGAATTIIPGLLGIDGLVPQTQVKYWLATAVVLGALTINRGFSNSKVQP